uniref:RING-type domain-containing protein n=1 Tax=Caenorhabditis japonica TaxID=281687 RepID=A0A8R1DXI4_CAEJA
MDGNLAEKYAKLMEYYGIAYERLESANDENKKLSENNQRLANENAELKKRIENQNLQLNGVQQAGKNRNREMENLNARNLDLQKEIETLKNKHISEITHFRNFIAKIEENQKKQMLTANHIRFDLLGKKEYLENELQVEKNNLEIVKKTYEEEKNKMIVEHNQEIDAIKRDSDVYIRNLVNDFRNTPNQQMEEMEGVLKTKDTYIEYLKEKQSDYDGNIKRLTSQCTTTSNQLKQLESKLRESETEKQTLIRELATLRVPADEQVGPQCPFCLNELTMCERELEQLPKCTNCTIRSHSECMARWLQEKQECPVCHVDAREMVNLKDIRAERIVIRI